MMRTQLADSDDITKTRIRYFLRDYQEIEIVADCADGAEARDKLSILEPDILILDVDLPKISGFEVLDSTLRVRMPYVIVISAQNKYALRAFEFGVTDYLIKPINKARFQEAINKVCRYIERDRRAEAGTPSLQASASDLPNLVHPMLERVPIKDGHQVRLISTSNIQHIISDRDYTNLHMTTREIIHTSERISQLEAKLPSNRFQRIQRSVIINLEHIQEIHSRKQNYDIVMRTGENFVSGYAYKRELSGLFAIRNKRRQAA